MERRTCSPELNFLILLQMEKFTWHFQCHHSCNAQWQLTLKSYDEDLPGKPLQNQRQYFQETIRQDRAPSHGNCFFRPPAKAARSSFRQVTAYNQAAYEETYPTSHKHDSQKCKQTSQIGTQMVEGVETGLGICKLK